MPKRTDKRDPSAANREADPLDDAPARADGAHDVAASDADVAGTPARPEYPSPSATGVSRAHRTATRAIEHGAPLPAGSGPGPRARPAVARPHGRERYVVPRTRSHRLMMLAGAMVTLVTCVLGAYAVVNAGFFRVDRVDVTGTTRLSTDEIARATGASGRELFAVDIARSRAAVERIAGVSRADVHRVWPRRLTVRVVERAPAAVWQVGAVGYTVDSSGTVLDFAPEPSMLTIYQADGGSGLVAGEHVDGDAVRAALQLRDTVPARVGQQAVRFEWTARNGLEIATDKGQRIRFGDGADIDFKLALWRGILDQARRDRSTVREIDLRFGDRAVYR